MHSERDDDVEPAGAAIAVDKPRLRGVLHEHAAGVALGAGAVLIAVAPSPRAAWAAAGFTFSLVLLYAVSAIYHRVHWSPVARARMRRADHASIFVLIAGTYTPIVVVGLPPGIGNRMLLLVWVGALLGVLQTIFWIKAPKVITALLCVAIGWVVIPYWSDATAALTSLELGCVFAGGVVYTVGALCYAAKRPNVVPGWFGYHEMFHLCTIIAAVLHFITIFSIIVRSPPG
jgi:hemolysin III